MSTWLSLHTLLIMLNLPLSDLIPYIWPYFVKNAPFSHSINCVTFISTPHEVFGFFALDLKYLLFDM